MSSSADCAEMVFVSLSCCLLFVAVLNLCPLFLKNLFVLNSLFSSFFFVLFCVLECPLLRNYRREEEAGGTRPRRRLPLLRRSSRSPLPLSRASGTTTTTTMRLTAEQRWQMRGQLLFREHQQHQQHPPHPAMSRECGGAGGTRHLLQHLRHGAVAGTRRQLQQQRQQQQMRNAAAGTRRLRLLRWQRRRWRHQWRHQWQHR